jgi:hypothetical protein
MRTSYGKTNDLVPPLTRNFESDETSRVFGDKFPGLFRQWNVFERTMTAFGARMFVRGKIAIAVCVKSVRKELTFSGRKLDDFIFVNR